MSDRHADAVNRRHILAGVAALASTGCLSASGSGQEPTTTAPDAVDAIETEMAAAGIDVVDATETPQGYDLAYRSRFDDELMAMIEVATVAETFAQLTADWDLGLFAPMIWEGGGGLTRYTINQTWAEEYRNGERTQIEYLSQIMNYMVGSGRSPGDEI